MTSSSVQPRGWTSPSKAMAVPRPPITVAAVDRVAVERLAGVLEQQLAEVRVSRVGQAGPTLVVVEVGEVGAEGGQSLAVAGLPADDRSVELALGSTLRSLDARPPGQLVERAQLEPLVERRGSPPLRPENGPPAQMRGGSNEKAPSSWST